MGGGTATGINFEAHHKRVTSREKEIISSIFLILLLAAAILAGVFYASGMNTASSISLVVALITFSGTAIAADEWRPIFRILTTSVVCFLIGSGLTAFIGTL